MQAVISNTLIKQIKPDAKPFEVRDTRLKGFLLRVQPSGSKSYYVEYARGRRVNLGRADAIKPEAARKEAKSVIAAHYQGQDPTQYRHLRQDHTYGSYLDEVYETWALANMRTADATMARLRKSFEFLLVRKLSKIDALSIEKWRSRRLKEGVKPSTVNRDLTALKAALSRAVDWGLLNEHPLSKVKKLKDAENIIVRYLSQREEKKLRKALDEREEEIRQGRDQANEWRKERDYALLPDLRKQAFADHLKPMVLLSLNSGLRRGELFGIAWKDVSLDESNLTVRGETAKSKRVRHIPLNKEAKKILQNWQKQTGAKKGLVFANPDGKKFDNARRSWANVLERAEIEDFRWHDMRHTFASKLVMAGVDLNVVRELLGHSDYKMTLRYAHLAPEHKAAAVAKLNN